MAQNNTEDNVFEVTCSIVNEDNLAEPEIVYQCSSCNVEFDDVDDHIKKYHKEETVKREVYSDQEQDDPLAWKLTPVQGLAFVIKTNDGRYECNECFKIYRSLKRFMDHVKTHGTETDKTLSELSKSLAEAHSSNTNLYDEIPTSDTKIRYKCKICTIELDSRKKILLHLSIHVNEATAHNNGKLLDMLRQLNCKWCNRSFENQSELDMHLRAHEENNTSHPEKSKKQKQEKSKKDSDKISYPCQYCKKEFKRPHEKVKHERIHTGEKPYSCEICGKQFRVTYCLALHKRSHSDDRPYVCSFSGCNKRFKTQSVYTHHLNTHGEATYQCPFCPKKFKTSVQLAGHKNTHTKPFNCQICQRPFASLYAVKQHMETHQNLDSNLKMTCQICGAQYARAFALKDHIKEAHPREAVEDFTEESEIYSVVLVEESTSAE